MSIRDAAIEYATIWGWPVFPTAPYGDVDADGKADKSPRCPRGYLDATTDVDQIDRWWHENPEYNIGVHLDGAGLFAVDYDPGSVPLDLPDTFAIKTPRGEHHLFRGSAPSSASRLAPHVDTRGVGGYTLLPPSRTIDGEYRVKHQRPFAPLPGWVKEKLRRPDIREGSSGVENYTSPKILDTNTSVDRGRTFLSSVAPAISGRGGNNATFAAAAQLYDFGLSPDKAIELLAEWNERCQPPWEPADLAHIANNAWRYHVNRGSAPEALGSVADVFGAMTGPTEDDALPVEVVRGDLCPIRLVRPLTIAEMRTRATTEVDPEFLWQGRILRGEPNLCTGDGGIGKTTLAINVTVAVASGGGLLGHPTIRAPVILMVAEDRYRAVLSSLDQVATARGLSLDTLDIRVLSTDSEDCEHLIANVTDEGEIHVTPFFRNVVEPALRGKPGSLFILDPISEFIRWDHNSDTATRAVVRSFLLPVAREFECTPLLFDHPSRAGLASGDGYGGSKEHKAAYPVLGYLRLTDPKDKGYHGRKSLTLEMVKVRYAQPTVTNFYRLENSPAYKMDPGDGMTTNEVDRMVLEHIILRIDAGLTVGKRNTIYGPDQAAKALETSTVIWNRSIERLCERGLISYVTDPGHRQPPTWTRGPKFGQDNDND